MRARATLLAVSVRRCTLAISLPAAATLALMAGPQLAGASPTTSTTGEASQITTSSATLVGYAYPGNRQTSYYFQYGQSEAYGQQTSPATLGSTTQTTHVSASLSGLSAYTTYHYRLVVVGAEGTTTNGQDRTFTTRKVPLTFTSATTRGWDLFGAPLSVEGTLSGTGSANHPVVLQANPFPFLAGFQPVGGPELTNAGGGFSFSVPGLLQNTQLRVTTVEMTPVSSRVMVELVAVRVALHLRPTGRHGYARLYGTVRPGEPGSAVAFQLLRSVGRPVTVASALITRGTQAVSRFSQVVHIRRPGLYRAFVNVVSGAQVSNHSRPILIR
jgi:hypothetical protein